MEVRKTIDHVELIVCDTGPRIAPDGHAKGLEPLYRTLGTNTTGSGLGLPIVQAIATHTGATIQLEYVDESAQTGLPVRVSLLQGNKELASAAFNARVIPSVAYTDPEVAWVGLTEEQAKAQGIKVKKGLFPWSASGRAIANGRDEGFTKLLFDDSPEAHGHGKILGGGIVGTHAGDMIGEIALAIEMGADAVDIGKTIHPHPTLGESIGMAAEVAHGSCTDVPPARK